MPTSDRFIDERKGAWQRLEDLLHLLDGSSLRRLHREEVRELGRIYRRTSSDLAIARAESRDPRLVNYLNSLVIRAHGRIYRAEAAEGRHRVRDFFARDFPRAFRRAWRYTATAAAVYFLFAALAFAGTARDPEFSELAGVPASFREMVLERKVRWWEEANQANQLAASMIATNNIRVTFNAFALGATFGVGTLYYMAFNGLLHASALALAYRAGYGHELLTFMAGHGVIELTCVFVAGGAGMLFGTALIFAGDRPRFDNLRMRGREAAQLITGCVPLLAVAGAIEGFVSPAHIPPAVKFAVAGLTGLALYSYLLFAGRGGEPPQG
ncbi:MAG TPA: stage II sporulation protein M [Pyrinomonadaceae bacterium]|jgi:uncharacterized membrane protein SpoIIM required for sporulation